MPTKLPHSGSGAETFGVQVISASAASRESGASIYQNIQGHLAKFDMRLRKNVGQKLVHICAASRRFADHSMCGDLLSPSDRLVLVFNFISAEKTQDEKAP